MSESPVVPERDTERRLLSGVSRLQPVHLESRSMLEHPCVPLRATPAESDARSSSVPAPGIPMLPGVYRDLPVSGQRLAVVVGANEVTTV